MDLPAACPLSSQPDCLDDTSLVYLQPGLCFSTLTARSVTFYDEILKYCFLPFLQLFGPQAFSAKYNKGVTYYHLHVVYVIYIFSFLMTACQKMIDLHRKST